MVQGGGPRSRRSAREERVLVLVGVVVLGGAAALAWSISTPVSLPVGPSAALASTERGGGEGLDAAVEEPEVERVGVPSPEREPVVAPPGSDWSFGWGRREAVPEKDLAALVDDLRDDQIRGNALTAFSQLIREDAAEPLLQQAMRNGDAQQREWAGQILLHLDSEATEDLVAFAVGHLRTDAPRNPLRRVLYAPTSAWIERNVEACTPRLRAAMQSGDGLQRLLASVLVARNAIDADLSSVVRNLAPRLDDNDIGGDALVAAHALYRLGPRVLPHLHAWKHSADAQALPLLELIEKDLRSPPRTHGDLFRRAHRAGVSITRLYHDPVHEYEFGRPMLPRR